LAIVTASLGLWDESLHHANLQHDIAEGLSDNVSYIKSFENLGRAYKGLGMRLESRQELSKALELTNKSGDLRDRVTHELEELDSEEMEFSTERGIV
jgi:hypothetical protein